MGWLRFFHRVTADSDHAREFEAHLNLEIEENLARGMTPGEARRAAHLKFGSPTLLREEVYRMNGLGFLEVLGRDLRYAFRMLMRSPGFTGASLLCLALGIGATTAIFSIVDAVLLRPLPYSDSQRLVRLYSGSPKPSSAAFAKFWISAPEYLQVRSAARSFDAMEAWYTGGANIAGGTEAARVPVCVVSGGLLPMLGAKPTLGRLIDANDDLPSAATSIVISYGLWERAFGSDPSVLSRGARFNGRKVNVVGVMPRGFQFPPGEADPAEVWLPLQVNPASPGSPTNHSLYLLGRLKPGVTVDRARQEMTALVSRWGEARSANSHVFDPQNHIVVMYPLADEVVGGARKALLVLLGAVAFVLLIACVNVANLLLARAEARQREIAIRKAMGVGIPGLVRQFVTEGVILSLGGAAAGLALASSAIGLLAATGAGSIPRASEIGLNWSVLLFCVILSFLTGMGFGLAPLAQIIAPNVYETLKSVGARTTSTVGAQRFRHALVVTELALALVLLIGTGLMVRAFWKLQQVDVGFRPRGVLSLRVALPGIAYPGSARVIQFWTTLQQRVSALPGVTSVSFMSGLPPVRPVDSNTTPIEGFKPASGYPAMEIDYYTTAGPRYFETMGIPLVEGRYFDDRDAGNAAPAVIVNQTLARIVAPGGSVLGRRMDTGEWRTIVGVVGDVKNAGVDKPAGTEIYLPFRQDAGRGRAGYLVVRGAEGAAPPVSAIRAEIRAMDDTLPAANVRLLDDVIAATQSRPRFLTVLLSLFAGVSLVLAAVGIFGVISYSVARRTAEFGVRIALGASSADVLRMVLAQGAAMAGAGLALGTAGALLLTRFLTSLLFGVSAVDGVTFAAMELLLAVVTMLACYLPARRATRVNPTVALRCD